MPPTAASARPADAASGADHVTLLAAVAAQRAWDATQQAAWKAQDDALDASRSAWSAALDALTWGDVLGGGGGVPRVAIKLVLLAGNRLCLEELQPGGALDSAFDVVCRVAGSTQGYSVAAAGATPSHAEAAAWAPTLLDAFQSSLWPTAAMEVWERAGPRRTADARAMLQAQGKADGVAAVLRRRLLSFVGCLADVGAFVTDAQGGFAADAATIYEVCTEVYALLEADSDVRSLFASGKAEMGPRQFGRLDGLLGAQRAWMDLDGEFKAASLAERVRLLRVRLETRASLLQPGAANVRGGVGGSDGRGSGGGGGGGGAGGVPSCFRAAHVAEMESVDYLKTKAAVRRRAASGGPRYLVDVLELAASGEDPEVTAAPGEQQQQWYSSLIQQVVSGVLVAEAVDPELSALGMAVSEWPALAGRVVARHQSVGLDEVPQNLVGFQLEGLVAQLKQRDWSDLNLRWAARRAAAQRSAGPVQRPGSLTRDTGAGVASLPELGDVKQFSGSIDPKEVAGELLSGAELHTDVLVIRGFRRDETRGFAALMARGATVLRVHGNADGDAYLVDQVFGVLRAGLFNLGSEYYRMLDGMNPQHARPEHGLLLVDQFDAIATLKAGFAKADDEATSLIHILRARGLSLVAGGSRVDAESSRVEAESDSDVEEGAEPVSKKLKSDGFRRYGDYSLRINGKKCTVRDELSGGSVNAEWNW